MPVTSIGVEKPAVLACTMVTWSGASLPAPLLMITGASVPAKDPRSLVQLVRSKPGTFSYGSYGTGSIGHLYGHLFNKQAGLDMVHVPYRGEALSLADVMGNQIPLAMVTASTAAPHIASGAIHPIAATGARRSPILPQVPTFSELGYKGMDAYGWFGFFAPKGIDRDLAEKISADVSRVAADPDLRGEFGKRGIEIATNAPSEFEELVRRDSTQWRNVVTELGLRVS